MAINQTITVSGGTKPYTAFKVSAFNAGTTGLTAGDITTDDVAGTVVLSGMPTAAGTARFTVNVTDSAGTTLAKDFSLIVNPTLGIAPAVLAKATVGTASTRPSPCLVAQSPYTTFEVSAFVGGGTGLTAANLTTDAVTGTVTLNGTPIAAGKATFTVNVIDTAGATLGKDYTLTVKIKALGIAPAALAKATAGTATNQTLTVSGGIKPYTTFNISAFSAGTTGLTASDITTDLRRGR